MTLIRESLIVRMRFLCVCKLRVAKSTYVDGPLIREQISGKHAGVRTHGSYPAEMLSVVRAAAAGHVGVPELMDFID